MTTRVSEVFDPDAWVVAPGSDETIVTAVQDAIRARNCLPDMGRQARQDTEARVRGAHEAVSEWVEQL